jgi:predicted CXXCH cytochrome family protein
MKRKQLTAVNFENTSMKPETTKARPRPASPEKRAFGRPFWIILTGAIGAVVAVSCATVNRTVMLPPHIAGAEFVGSETCADCHDEITRDFGMAEHARLKAPGDNAKNVGCESCHGPGSIHNDTGGAYHTIVNPRKSADVCFQCHQDLRGQFNLPHHHPLVEGQMSCGDCHDPHKGSAHQGGGTQLASLNDTCLKCHPSQRGPHVFEHEAIREGCTTCHAPHGSVNARMLTERNAVLCLKCHVQEPNLTIGGVNHRNFLSRGTCWTAGCHEAVHGSQVSTSLRF